MKNIKKVGSALAALESVASGGNPSSGGDAQDNNAKGPSGRPSIANPRQQYRVMDDIARKRRLKHELDSLERDNYHEDPHANLTLSKKVPKFEDGIKTGEKSIERRRSNLRLRTLNLVQLIEEDSKRPGPNYTTATAPTPDKYNQPRRHFCGVCGLTGKYTCITCGSRFCSITCQATHKETRCMKWIA